MKKCPGCSREVDKMAVICEYCGRLEKEHLSKSPKTASNDIKKEKSQKSTK